MAGNALSLSGRPVRGVSVTPPARLVRFHRHSLVNLLLLGGSAEDRLQVAYAFHRESLLRRGPFVCVDAQHEEQSLYCALHAWMFGLPEPWSSPLLAAEQGTLFVDTVSSLLIPTQQLLLDFTRRCLNAPPESGGEPWVGRLAVGNPSDLAALASGRLFLPTLYDSLDKVRIELPNTSRGAA